MPDQIFQTWKMNCISVNGIGRAVKDPWFEIDPKCAGRAFLSTLLPQRSADFEVNQVQASVGEIERPQFFSKAAWRLSIVKARRETWTVNEFGTNNADQPARFAVLPQQLEISDGVNDMFNRVQAGDDVEGFLKRLSDGEKAGAWKSVPVLPEQFFTVINARVHPISRLDIRT